MAGERLYRLPTPGGLRVFSWEAPEFPRDRLDPLLCLADAQRDRLVALAYELDAAVCPNYDEAVGCTIYEDRPLVCRAYPLLVVDGDGGPEVAVSGRCPGKVAVQAAADDAERPEPVLARAYPDEFAPALAVPAMIQALAEVISFLEAAEVVDPVAGLDEAAVRDRTRTPPLDLIELVEAEGVMDRGTLTRRAEGIVDRLRERWAADPAATEEG